MKLKKLSAILALLAIAGLLLHVGYNIAAYILFLYNPLVTKLVSIPFLAFACLHGIFAMLSLFLQGEGTNLTSYPKKNMATILQRISGALLFPMILLHMNTFGILKASAEEGRMWLFWILFIFQFFFYATAITHVCVSFSKALITVGLLTSREIQKRIDLVMYILGAITFLGASFVISSTQLAMFFG